MIPLNRLARRAVVLVAASAAALGLASVPALAAPTVTVTGIVTDEAGNPLEGISVYGFQTPTELPEDDEEEWEDFGGEADLGDTDADGRFTYTTRVNTGEGYGYGFTTDKPWTFAFRDTDEDAAQPWQRDTLQHPSLSAGRNELQTKVLVPGGLIEGTVQTPSGKPIADAGVYTYARSDDDFDAFEDFEDYEYTDVAGEFRFGGLRAGTYEYGVDFETEDDYVEGDEISTTTEVATSQEVTGVVLKTRVPCTRTVSVASPTKKTVKVTIRSTAKDFGVTIPGGTVTVKRGTKKLADRALSSASSLTILTFASQPTGTQKYTVSYKSGDCRGWTSTTKSVTVRK